jgi:hypothetical protein
MFWNYISFRKTEQTNLSEAFRFLGLQQIF